MPGGNNTLDRIFLLSIDEVVQYFGEAGLPFPPWSVGKEARCTATRICTISEICIALTLLRFLLLIYLHTMCGGLANVLCC